MKMMVLGVEVGTCASWGELNKSPWDFLAIEYSGVNLNAIGRRWMQQDVFFTKSLTVRYDHGDVELEDGTRRRPDWGMLKQGGGHQMGAAEGEGE